LAGAQLREAIDAPGMVVLQFAFDGDGTNVHRPHNHYENSICYPGTHDNDTAVGWCVQHAARDTRTVFSVCISQRVVIGSNSATVYVSLGPTT
jgi:4-alpha-glucanotransferase